MEDIYLSDNHRISVVSETTETKKDKMKKQNNEKRKKVEKGGVEYGSEGHIIATDSESISKIVSATTALDQGIVSSINWKAKNGWIKNVDKETMFGISTKVTKHVQKSFNTENEIENLIDSLTYEELDSLDIEEEWLNRFGE